MTEGVFTHNVPSFFFRVYLSYECPVVSSIRFDPDLDIRILLYFSGLG